MKHLRCRSDKCLKRQFTVFVFYRGKITSVTPDGHAKNEINSAIFLGTANLVDFNACRRELPEFGEPVVIFSPPDPPGSFHSPLSPGGSSARSASAKGRQHAALEGLTAEQEPACTAGREPPPVFVVNGEAVVAGEQPSTGGGNTKKW